jgi:hypothetical protein
MERRAAVKRGALEKIRGGRGDFYARGRIGNPVGLLTCTIDGYAIVSRPGKLVVHRAAT